MKQIDRTVSREAEYHAMAVVMALDTALLWRIKQAYVGAETGGTHAAAVFGLKRWIKACIQMAESYMAHQWEKTEYESVTCLSGDHTQSLFDFTEGELARLRVDLITDDYRTPIGVKATFKYTSPAHETFETNWEYRWCSPTTPDEASFE